MLAKSFTNAIRTLIGTTSMRFISLFKFLCINYSFLKVGLRNVYICCCYAARLMTKRDELSHPAGGLIVNLSSVGGLQYLFSVAYGVGKAAVDRMSKSEFLNFPFFSPKQP